MVRYNKLKIYISAGEAKPGGLIGAMLSPYLFSTNMNDFCKKFNDLTKDYTTGVIIPVVLFCDIVERLYTFHIKPLAYSMILLNLFSFVRRKRIINIKNVYDIVLYYMSIYKLDVYRSALLFFSVYRTIKKKMRFCFTLKEVFFSKVEGK